MRLLSIPRLRAYLGATCPFSAQAPVGHRAPSLPGCAGSHSLGVPLDCATEHATPPVCEPKRVGAVDRERGDAHNRRGLLAHAVLLLGTGHGPVVESVHAASQPDWMVRKGERILPSLCMQSNKVLPTLEHVWRTVTRPPVASMTWSAQPKRSSLSAERGVRCPLLFSRTTPSSISYNTEGCCLEAACVEGAVALWSVSFGRRSSGLW